MKRFALTGLVLLACVSRMGADMAPQPQVSLTAGMSGSWNFEWEGVVERTYFSQWSMDLVTWTYFQDIEHGPGLKPSSFNSETSKYFVRLCYTDIPTSDPELADFDLDGLGNRAELDIGTDPLDSDSDHDGISDGAEISGAGDPLSDTDGDVLRKLDSDGDGVSDAVELLRGTSPTLWDSDGDGFNDLADVFPLNPMLHDHPSATSGDITKPAVTLETPANATFVSGP